LLYADGVNSWRPNSTEHENTETLLYATKNADLEVEMKKNQADIYR